MNQHKVVGWGLIITIVSAVLVGIIEPESSDALYTLAGLGYMVFGVWGAILLFTIKK